MKKQISALLLMILFVFGLSGCKKSLTTGHYSAGNTVNKITFEDNECNLNFALSEDEYVSIDYSEIKSKYTYKIVLNNSTGSLVIKREDNRKGFAKGSFDKTPVTTIYLPKDSSIEINATLSSGNVSMNDVSTGNATVATTSGTISLNNVSSAGEYDFTSSTGDITIEDSSVNSFKIETSRSGNLEISDSVFESKLEATVYESQATISKITAANVSLNVTKGNIELNNPSISNNLSAVITTGDINAALPLKKAAYTVTAKTETGTGSTSSAGGNILVTLVSTVGNISISYGK